MRMLYMIIFICTLHDCHWIHFLGKLCHVSSFPSGCWNAGISGHGECSFSGAHFLKSYVIMSLPKDYCSRIHDGNQYTKQAGFHRLGSRLLMWFIAQMLMAGRAIRQTTREDVYFIGVNSVNSGKQMCMIWILYVNHEYWRRRDEHGQQQKHIKVH